MPKVRRQHRRVGVGGEGRGLRTCDVEAEDLHHAILVRIHPTRHVEERAAPGQAGACTST